MGVVNTIQRGYPSFGWLKIIPISLDAVLFRIKINSVAFAGMVSNNKLWKIASLNNIQLLILLTFTKTMVCQMHIVREPSNVTLGVPCACIPVMD
ncbi:hypothetical protein TNIN_254351 [Trichonephila inaurata madagascariensis]|uniref:Uncharacterized protein n=1 Tax=Trichonephila inaurata madagascariensis TaxID=2747483 RepID=A0A8X7CPV5_9ARAC|nr:hypothetical protein TNIN_254351 [Trichonephila inaurata madagascariensis]